jgi:hypothetical protein
MTRALLAVVGDRIFGAYTRGRAPAEVTGGLTPAPDCALEASVRR